MTGPLRRGVAGALAAAAGCALSAWAIAGEPPPSALARFAFDAPPAFHSELPGALREISGLAVTNDGRVLAINDEVAVVHELDIRRGTIARSFSLGRPPIRGDFEGLAVVETRVFLVTSAGMLYESAEAGASGAVPHRTHQTGFGRRCEVEGLSYDAASASLLLACKTARSPALRDSVAILRWPLDPRRRASGARGDIVTHAAPIARAARARHFHPSGVERDPRTGNYVVVAAVERALVELTPGGRVVAVRKLPALVGEQVEAIAFARDGSLILGSEARRGPATLTVYAPTR